jgi:hypothetical protein
MEGLSALLGSVPGLYSSVIFAVLPKLAPILLITAGFTILMGLLQRALNNVFVWMHRNDHGGMGAGTMTESYSHREEGTGAFEGWTRHRTFRPRNGL